MTARVEMRPVVLLGATFARDLVMLSGRRRGFAAVEGVAYLRCSVGGRPLLSLVCRVMPQQLGVQASDAAEDQIPVLRGPCRPGPRPRRTRSTAIRLLVGESPAATWEMALGADDDPRLSLEGRMAGCDTDGATGCFADAGAWKSLAALYGRGLIQGEPDLDGYEGVDDGSLVMQRTWDTASGGALLAFATTGDGTYPVRLGRSADGEVVAVVVLVESMPELPPE